jgi:hypothetical protein
MGGAAVDHPEHRADDAANGRDLPAVTVARRRDGVIVPEELVGAVDEMNVQGTDSTVCVV